MKKNIHPIQQKVTIVCTSCKKNFTSESTLKEIRVDTCSNCHNFYTGNLSFENARGRVERFRTKYNIKKNK